MNEQRSNEAPAHDARAGYAAFEERLAALRQPAAFPFTFEGPVELVQTHASAVLLAGDRAYKLKKPNDFGFFNYSTPELRRHFCSLEALMNKRLAPRVYLGVAPVLATAGGGYRFGDALAPEDLPQPGGEFAGARVVDYAVVMVRLAEEDTLGAMVRSGQADSALLERIAAQVAAFHAAAQTNERISHFGSLEVIRGNWTENFEQMRPFIGRALDQETFDQIERYVSDFLRLRAPLLELRVREGRVRDTHGDLRLQHVYVTQGEAGLPRLAIVDCIEFNDRFHYEDVTSEVAFLTMELDEVGRPDLSRAFVTSYVAVSGDTTLRELLPFYLCYRACVRGKVLAFQLDQSEVPERQREAARQQSSALFELAARYAAGRAEPTLTLLGGQMGTGKTTLARALCRELGWMALSSDVTRKQLAGVPVDSLYPEAFGAGLYSAEWTARTYASLRDQAARTLAEGRSVIVDASFARRDDRRMLAGAAAGTGARVIFLECRCPADVALARLERRWERRAREDTRPADERAEASDGRPAIYAAQAAAWEAFDGADEPGVDHIPLDTATPLTPTIEQALEALDVARLACFGVDAVG